jgi:hypothetical protein
MVNQCLGKKAFAQLVISVIRGKSNAVEEYPVRDVINWGSSVLTAFPIALVGQRV